MPGNPFAAAPVHVLNLEEESKGVSPKVFASTIGGAIATILWIILAGYVPHLKEHIGDGGVTAITGATSTLFAAMLGYFVTDPLRTATMAPKQSLGRQRPGRPGGEIREADLQTVRGPRRERRSARS